MPDAAAAPLERISGGPYAVRPFKLKTCRAVALLLAGCAGINQFPDDPASDQKLQSEYREYFKQTYITQYEGASSTQRQSIRDTIVINRMLAYDQTFAAFERQLLAEGNSFSTGADLTVLALNGVGATAGVAAAKAALAAASAAIVGAKTAISADLFYQRTLPALIAQMDANRASMKAILLTGLAKSDTEYPLARALFDLQQLSDAGSMVGALGSITESAGIQKEQAEKNFAVTRTAEYKATLQTRQSLVAEVNLLKEDQAISLSGKIATLIGPNSDLQKLISAFNLHDPTQANLKNAQWLAGTSANH